jgi:hypothetical protein
VLLSYGIVEIEEAEIGFMLWGEIEGSKLVLGMWDALFATKRRNVSRLFS